MHAWILLPLSVYWLFGGTAARSHQNKVANMDLAEYMRAGIFILSVVFCEAEMLYVSDSE